MQIPPRQNWLIQLKMTGPSQSVLVASVELCFLLFLTDAPAFSPPLLAAASHQWSFPRPAPHWLLIVYHVWSASLQGCTSVLLFGFICWFFFSFSKTPSRHSHTRTDPTSPRSATETETIQERCVSLQTAALHLCPLTSALFSLSSHFQLLLICADGIMKYHFLFLVKSSSFPLVFLVH